MDTLLQVLPNLSIGVVSVLALVYVVMRFLDALDKRAEAHAVSMKEREDALRTVETEMRTLLSAALHEATTAIEQNSRVMGRVVSILDRGIHV